MRQTKKNTKLGRLKVHDLSDAKMNPRTEKVLLLDDQEAFATLVKDFLTFHHMEVDRGVNGVEGVQYVLKSDYDFIVCDMVMPEFPGDMFYRAVERVKPHLCPRFIFVTGHKGDDKINEFIRRVKGLVLWKPFELDRLLDAMKAIRSVKIEDRASRSLQTEAWGRTAFHPSKN